MYILIYYKIDRPKENKKLQVKKVAITFHKTKEFAKYRCYEKYGMCYILKTKKKPLIITFHYEQWSYNYCEFCMLVKYGINISISSDIEKYSSLDKFLRKIMNENFKGGYDDSINLSKLIAKYQFYHDSEKYYKTHEMVTEGIINENFLIFDHNYYKWWTKVKGEYFSKKYIGFIGKSIKAINSQDYSSKYSFAKKNK